MDTGSEKGGKVTPVMSGRDDVEEAYVTSNSNINETKRGLSARHVQLMAIGGSIGTGLWVCFSQTCY